MMILVSTEGSQQARRNGITILSACWRLDSRKVIVVVFQELLLTLEVLRASGAHEDEEAPNHKKVYRLSRDPHHHETQTHEQLMKRGTKT